MEYFARKSRLTFILRNFAMIVTLCATLSPHTVTASTNRGYDASIVFSRTTMRIHPKVTAHYVPPTLKPFTIEVEIRPYSYFRNPGLYIAGMLAQDDAYLIALPPQEQHWLEYANIFSPMDIVVIDTHGMILQIFPQFVLSNLTTSLQLPSSSTAVLFLAPGAAKALTLGPQFTIENELFLQQPEVIQ